MKKHLQSLSYKLLSTLIIATTLPMLIYCFLVFFSTRNTSEENYIKQTRNAWRVVAANIEHSLSNSIDVANKGIYLNRTLQNLLFSRDSNVFPYAESTNSSLIFSYMTNIYSITPNATQIQFSTYKSDKNFLLTTSNLQKYLKSDISTSLDQDMTPAFYAWIEPPHQQTNYGHQMNYKSHSLEENSANGHASIPTVFTVCLPIYHLPNINTPIGIVHIDISIDFFAEICDSLFDRTEEFLIIDATGNIIFSSEPSLIGTCTNKSWIPELMEQTQRNSTSFFSEKSGSSLRICQKLPGDYYDWYMVKSIPKANIYQNSNAQLILMLTALGICLTIVILLNGYAILRSIRPLKKATTYLNSISTQSPNLNVRLSDYVSWNPDDEIGILLHSLEEMIDTINNFIIRQYELEIINRTTELKMLEAQINPHFIYNTLQCLATKSLEHHDQEQYDYISSFGQLMQYSMDTNRTLVTVQDELSHIDRYIRLQKMRFTNHLSVHFDIADEIRELTVPKMILQPLIENSFKHGNLFKRDPGIILIKAFIKQDYYLHLDIIDNGSAPAPNLLMHINRQLTKIKSEYSQRLIRPCHLSKMEDRPPLSHSDIRNAKENLYATNNIGLTNVLLRLLLNFGKECSMELTANDLGGTTVHLIISHKTYETPNITPCTNTERSPHESTYLR